MCVLPVMCVLPLMISHEEDLILFEGRCHTLPSTQRKEVDILLGLSTSSASKIKSTDQKSSSNNIQLKQSVTGMDRLRLFAPVGLFGGEKKGGENDAVEDDDNVHDWNGYSNINEFDDHHNDDDDDEIEDDNLSKNENMNKDADETKFRGRVGLLKEKVR